MKSRALRVVLTGLALVLGAAACYQLGQRQGFTAGRAIGNLEGTWRTGSAMMGALRGDAK